MSHQYKVTGLILPLANEQWLSTRSKKEQKKRLLSSFRHCTCLISAERINIFLVPHKRDTYGHYSLGLAV